MTTHTTHSTARPAGLALVGAMLDTARASAASLADRIANVRPLPYAGSGPERFAFTFDGQPHAAALRGRNRDLCLGFGEGQDRAIAARALIDGDAEPVKGGATP